jgi:hypothetical protein
MVPTGPSRWASCPDGRPAAEPLRRLSRATVRPRAGDPAPRGSESEPESHAATCAGPGLARRVAGATSAGLYSTAPGRSGPPPPSPAPPREDKDRSGGDGARMRGGGGGGGGRHGLRSPADWRRGPQPGETRASAAAAGGDSAVGGRRQGGRRAVAAAAGRRAAARRRRQRRRAAAAARPVTPGTLGVLVGAKPQPQPQRVRRRRGSRWRR